MRLTHIWAALALLSIACGPVPVRDQVPDVSTHQLETLHSPEFDVTVDIDRGGAIIALDLHDGNGNLIDNGDQTGRSLQASLYDGHWDANSWPCNNTSQVWGWNPVQEGDACQALSGGHIESITPTSIATSTTPRQWNSLRGVSRLALTQTLTIVSPGVLRIDYTVTNHEAFTIGTDNWHELPVAYLNPALTLGTTAKGPQTRTSMLGFRDGSDWVSLSTDAGLTVALYAPGDHLWSIGFGGDTKPTSWLQAWQWLELAPEQTGTATAWLIVGHSLDEVRARLSTLKE